MPIARGESSSALRSDWPKPGRSISGIARDEVFITTKFQPDRRDPLRESATHRDRIAEDAQVFDFELSAADMEELDALDRSGGTQAALERKWW